MEEIIEKITAIDFSYYLTSTILILIYYIGKKTRYFINEKIINPRLNKFFEVTETILNGDQKKYYRLAAKYIKQQHIGGMKDQSQSQRLDNLYIDIPVGIINASIAGATSIIDNLNNVPIRDKRDALSIISDPNNSDISNLLILGGPGSGKSTLVNHILKKLVKKKIKNLIPIPILAREISYIFNKNENKKPKLTDLISKYFSEYVEEENLKLPINWLNNNIHDGNCLILIDGIDELESEDAINNFIQWIKRETQRYCQNKFIITSRPQALEKKSIPNFQTRYICPLGRESINKFIDKYYEIISESRIETLDNPSENSKEAIHHQEKMNAKGLKSRISERKVLDDLSKRPMILTMMLMVHTTGHTLPEKRCALFDRVMAVMLGGRNDSKNIPIKIPEEIKIDILSIISHQMIDQNMIEIEANEIIKICNKNMGNYSQNISTTILFDEAIVYSGIMIETRKSAYAFCHENFKEYLAARYLQERLNRIGSEEILKMARNKKWTETLLLLTGLIDSSSLILDIISKNDDDYLEILVLILEEAKSINLDVRKLSEKYLTKSAITSNTEQLSIIGRAFLKKRLTELGSNEEVITDRKSVTEIEMIYYRLNNEYNLEDIIKLNYDEITKRPAKTSLSEAINFCEWITNLSMDGWSYKIPSNKITRENSFWAEQKNFPTLTNSQKTQLFNLTIKEITRTALYLRPSLVRVNHLNGPFEISTAKEKSNILINKLSNYFETRNDNILARISKILSISTCISEFNMQTEDFQIFLEKMSFKSSKNAIEYCNPIDASRIPEISRKLTEDIYCAIEKHSNDIILGYETRHLARIFNNISMEKMEFRIEFLSLFEKIEIETNIWIIFTLIVICLEKVSSQEDRLKLLAIMINISCQKCDLMKDIDRKKEIRLVKDSGIRRSFGSV